MRRWNDLPSVWNGEAAAAAAAAAAATTAAAVAGPKGRKGEWKSDG